jgi:5,10-methylenetetrahydromethanopterin reductase
MPTPGSHSHAQTWPEHALLRFGTVLRPGEDHTHSRVIEAAGPGYASIVHATWQQVGKAVDTLPGGEQWRTAIEAERPRDRRHLVVHQGHLTRLTERDRAVVTAAGPAMLRPGWTGDPAALATRLAEAGAAGITEVVYIPAGPDVSGELTAFAAVAQSNT